MVGLGEPACEFHGQGEAWTLGCVVFADDARVALVVRVAAGVVCARVPRVCATEALRVVDAPQ